MLKKYTALTLSLFLAEQSTLGMGKLKYISPKTLVQKVAVFYPKAALSQSKIEYFLRNDFRFNPGLKKKDNYHPVVVARACSIAARIENNRYLALKEIYGTGRMVEVEYDTWKKTQNSNFYLSEAEKLEIKFKNIVTYLKSLWNKQK